MLAEYALCTSMLWPSNCTNKSNRKLYRYSGYIYRFHNWLYTLNLIELLSRNINLSLCYLQYFIFISQTFAISTNCRDRSHKLIFVRMTGWGGEDDTMLAVIHSIPILPVLKLSQTMLALLLPE